jgi:hypothetical protein
MPLQHLQLYLILHFCYIRTPEIKKALRPAEAIVVVVKKVLLFIDEVV